MPDRPIGRNSYTCAKQFDLTELERLCVPTSSESWIGVALVHGSSTSLYRASSLGHVERVCTLATATQKHQRKGGQSAARIQRLRQNKQQHNVLYVTEEICDAFYDYETNRPTVDYVVVGGTAQTYEMVFAELLEEPLSSCIIGPLPCSTNAEPRDLLVLAASQIESYERKADESNLAELRECLAMQPELLEFLPFDRLQLQTCRRVFVNRAPPPLLESDKDAQDRSKIIVVRRSDYLDQFGGCVAIKYKMVDYYPLITEELESLGQEYLQYECEKQPFCVRLDAAMLDKIAKKQCSALSIDNIRPLEADVKAGDLIRFYEIDADGRNVDYYWHECILTFVGPDVFLFRYLCSGVSYQSISAEPKRTREFVSFQVD